MRPMELQIATCKSRTQKVFKAKTISWPDLAAMLSTPKRTSESMAEYQAMSKEARAEVKDVGGFVGGALENGRRTKVISRSLLTLDADKAGPDLWEQWQKKYHAAAVLYSTHSHTEDSPRARLVIPLSRSVSVDEYSAVVRKVAETLGMDRFDPTTFEAGRLMYWPSCSRDGEFWTECNNSPVLNPDDILSQYADWHDATQWPKSSVFEKIRATNEKHMQAIEDKRGPVGVFCRTYNIHEAIAKYVPDYRRSEVYPDRYTYIKGTAANGVITYNDRYSYSHHATDPATGREVNAFDLVRLHKFADLDADATSDTPVTNLPSYKAMCDLVRQDPACQELLYREQTGDFETDDVSWTSEFDRDKNGLLLSTAHNIQLVFHNDAELKDAFAFDEFARRDVITRSLPWKKYNNTDNILTDADDAQLRIWFENKYGLRNCDKRIADCVVVECMRRRFHPVRDYLNGLKWDGIPRIDKLLPDYFGCEDNDYIHAIMWKTLLGAVTRIFHPGAQFDTMLVLKGPQGCGKSTFFRRLGKNWFSDSVKDVRSKDALEGIQGVWIIEMSELAAMRKADAEVIKSFLSSKEDRFRKAYGHRTELYPRQCVFVATTNEAEFLRDRTGNRRFWIASIPKGAVPSKDIFSITEYEIDQVWAETKALYDKHTETLTLNKAQTEKVLAAQQEVMQEDPRVETIREYLDRELPDDWESMGLADRRSWLRDEENQGTVERQKVCLKEIWFEALDYDTDRNLDRYEAGELNTILDSFPDWQKSAKAMRFSHYGVQRGFIRVGKRC